MDAGTRPVDARARLDVADDREPPGLGHDRGATRGVGDRVLDVGIELHVDVRSAVGDVDDGVELRRTAPRALALVGGVDAEVLVERVGAAEPHGVDGAAHEVLELAVRVRERPERRQDHRRIDVAGHRARPPVVGRDDLLRPGGGLVRGEQVEHPLGVRPEGRRDAHLVEEALPVRVALGAGNGLTGAAESIGEQCLEGRVGRGARGDGCPAGVGAARRRPAGRVAGTGAGRSAARRDDQRHDDGHPARDGRATLGHPAEYALADDRLRRVPAPPFARLCSTA